MLACSALLQPNAILAEPVPVRHTEGLTRGFLVLRTLDDLGSRAGDGPAQKLHGGHGSASLLL
jgi:hypothetical protein